MYKYYKIHIEKGAYGEHYFHLLNNVRHERYDTYLKRFISHFTFIREIKKELSAIYRRRVEQYHEIHYHPDRIKLLTDEGFSFTYAVNYVDAEMESQKKYYDMR